MKKKVSTKSIVIKPAKKKAVKKSAIQRSQNMLAKAYEKHLIETHKANMKAIGPAISSKRFGNTPVVEDESSEPTESKQSSLTNLKLGPRKSEHRHIVVEARAGTGKTFTLIVGVAWAYGQKIWPEIQREMARRINVEREAKGEHLISVEKFRVKPSAEQQEVWNALAESEAETKTVTYCAFNKSIVEEFGHKWGWMAKMLADVGITLQFCTINSLGHKVCMNAYNRFKVSGFNPEAVLGRVRGVDPWELKKTKPGRLFVDAVTSLVDVCKLTLTGWTEKGGFNAESISDEELDELTKHFDVDTGSDKTNIYDAVRETLVACHDVSNEACALYQIDYNDQNWLPVVNNLKVSQVDLLMVDEGQDLPRCKQEFARMVGRRVVLVGDVNQAIYGFAGADVHSIPRMKELLDIEASLKLTYTYRCAKAIVIEANKIVPDFYAHEDNPEGSILHSNMEKYAEIAQDKDMVLCRVNAPLISQALKFVKDGRKAIVRGRDFGKSLVKFVNSFETQDITELLQKVHDWAQQESQRESSLKNPNEQKLISINDKKECIVAFCEGTTTVIDVTKKIDRIFAGKQCPRCKKSFDDDVQECYGCKCELVKPDGVLFSSIHKAKGLEANRVFLLQPKGASIPHPMAKSSWQIEQEWNCKYIAVTRAISELIYVDP